MRFKSIASACAAAALSLAVISGGSVASAADIAVLKAPTPPPAAAASDIHGFFDVTFTNDYITPRGLLVTNTGLTTQILNGLSFDLYKDPTGTNQLSVYFGTWNDLWSEQNNTKVGSWNEFDWFVGVDARIAKYWKAGVKYIVFLSPPGNFAQERNVELSLAFDDGALTGYPVSINPYVKWFNAISGDSTVVVGNQGKTYDVELGLVPTLGIKKFTGVPLTFAAPTWLTVGPTSYWNRGVTGCGMVATTPCSLSNAGVFSTGLQAKYALEAIPARWGSWYLKAGFQYYHLINDSLLLAQAFTGTATSFLTAHRHVWTWIAGLGFNF
jgi:hypothetical protein